MVISPEDPRNQAPAARAGRPPPGPVGSPHGLGPSSPFQAPSQWSGHLALRTVWADPQTPYRVTGFLSAVVPQAGAGAGAPRWPAGEARSIAVLVPCGGVQADSPLGARPS